MEKPLIVFDGKPAEAKGRKDYYRIQSRQAMEVKIAMARKENDEDDRKRLSKCPLYF